MRLSTFFLISVNGAAGGRDSITGTGGDDFNEPL